MTTTTYIFNQYYIDFLKRIKDVAKENRDDSSTAKGVYKAIKANYGTLDKSSDEYIKFVNESIGEAVWNTFAKESAEWMKNNKELELYSGISLGNIDKLIDDDYLCNHFITVFYIFRKELSDELSANIVKILQSIDGKDLMDSLEDSDIKTVLTNLRALRDKQIKDKAGFDMNFIEDTTLGKLAKEILEDVDVGKLQKSMQNNNDILKAIGDPDSGFADIISSVSKKMANKISNGELKQDNLIQDAMKFASIMPNLFGGPTGPTGPTGPGSAQKKGKQPDMSNLMSMMSSMMGSDTGGLNELFKGMNKNTSGASSKGSKKVFNEGALKKIAKAKKLKKKLYEKRKAAEAAAQDAQNNKNAEDTQAEDTQDAQTTQDVQEIDSLVTNPSEATLE